MLSVWREKRLGMRIRKSIERSEQQRFHVFSAIQISDVFKKILQGGVTVDYYWDVDADVKMVKPYIGSTSELRYPSVVHVMC